MRIVISNTSKIAIITKTTNRNSRTTATCSLKTPNLKHHNTTVVALTEGASPQWMKPSTAPINYYSQTDPHLTSSLIAAVIAKHTLTALLSAGSLNYSFWNTAGVLEYDAGSIWDLVRQR